jgi:hypothetical protein
MKTSRQVFPAWYVGKIGKGSIGLIKKGPARLADRTVCGGIRLKIEDRKLKIFLGDWKCPLGWTEKDR